MLKFYQPFKTLNSLLLCATCRLWCHCAVRLFLGIAGPHTTCMYVTVGYCTLTDSMTGTRGQMYLKLSKWPAVLLIVYYEKSVVLVLILSCERLKVLASSVYSKHQKPWEWPVNEPIVILWECVYEHTRLYRAKQKAHINMPREDNSYSMFYKRQKYLCKKIWHYKGGRHLLEGCGVTVSMYRLAT